MNNQGGNGFRIYIYFGGFEVSPMPCVIHRAGGHLPPDLMDGLGVAPIKADAVYYKFTVIHFF